MWTPTRKKFNDQAMFFQFYQKDDYCIFNLTNMKQIYAKAIQESSFASIYSVCNCYYCNIRSCYSKILMRYLII